MPRRTTAISLLFLCLSLLIATPPAAAQSANADQHWTPLDLFGGRVNALTVDPADPRTLYAATAGAGVYTSTDGGETWRPSNRGLTTFEIAGVAVDPADRSRLYAGGQAPGFFLSHDGGRSWTVSRQGLPGQRVFASRPLVDPADPRFIYLHLGFVHGLYRSADRGLSWQPIGRELIPLTDFRALVIDPLEPSRLFYAGSRPRVWTSEDRGDTWRRAGALPRGTVEHLAIDENSTLYASTFDHGAFKSTDGGETWSELALPLQISFIAVAPSTPSILYAVDTIERRIFRSSDGGATWSEGGGLGDRTLDLAIDPGDPDLLYVAQETLGVIGSTDGGRTWAPRHQGLVNPYVTALAAAPSAPSVLYAYPFSHLQVVGSGRGVIRSSDGGETWSERSDGLPEVPPSLAVDAGDEDLVYAGFFDQGVFRSTDGGSSWSRLEQAPAAGGEVLADPQRPDAVFLVRGDVYRSTDRGETWSAAGLPLIRALAFARSSSRIYAAGDVIAVSEDGGETWSVGDRRIPSSAVVDLAVDAFDDRVLYTRDTEGEGSAAVFRSLDGGFSWERLFPINDAFGPPINRARQLITDPSKPGSVYLGGDFGLARSLDHGVTWARLVSGLGAREPLRLEARAGADPAVYAATTGGVFRLGPFPKPHVLALQGGRFEVEVSWRDVSDRSGSGRAVSVAAPATAEVPQDQRAPEFLFPGPVPLASDDSAVLEFFSPSNWEMLIKVLDGRAINGHHWVFLAGATTVGFTTTVTDTACGVRRSYTNPLGRAAPAVTDTRAFAPCADPAPPSCAAGEGVICLGEDGRFRVETVWTDFSQNTGVGVQAEIAAAGLAESEDSGLFYFFSPQNWELFVKVLDGCEINGRVWVFAAATTNVEYTLKVTDRDTGEFKTYFNPLGRSAAAVTDTRAFAVCPLR